MPQKPKGKTSTTKQSGFDKLFTRNKQTGERSLAQKILDPGKFVWSDNPQAEEFQYNFDAAQTALNDPRIDENRKRLIAEAEIAAIREAEAYKQQQEFRGGQTQLVADLQAQARGEGPSLAQLQLQRGQAAGLSNALAMAQGARGAGRGAALRSLALQQGALSGETAQSAAELRMREQLSAREQLGNALAQGRGMDISVLGQQGGQKAGFIGMQTAQDLEAQQRALNFALLREQLVADEKARVQAIRAGQKEAANARQASMIQGGAMLLGSLYGGPAGGAAASTATQNVGGSGYSYAPSKLPGTP